MNFKNQKTLILGASTIIGLTAASLFALNIVVEKISLIEPPHIALGSPRMPPRALGTDDALKGLPPGQMPPNGAEFGMDGQVPGKLRQPKTPPQAPNGALRRVRNGKDAPDIRRMAPPSMNGQGANDNQNRVPPSPPSMPSYPPQPPYGSTDDQQRQMMEEEMQRRRDMYYDQTPPQDYYPPPSPYDYYDNGYDNEGYDYDYEGYYDNIESKASPPSVDKKTAEINEEDDYYPEEDLPEEDEDEYLQEIMEE